MSRDRVVMVRLSEEEHGELVRAAVREGFAVSSWVREVSLDMAREMNRREAGDGTDGGVESGGVS